MTTPYREPRDPYDFSPWEVALLLLATCIGGPLVAFLLGAVPQ